MLNKFCLFLLLFYFFANSNFTKAQEPKFLFGKNRIQYKEFKWYTFSSENFDVSYYTGGRELAETAINYLEDDFSKITDIIGYAPYAKTKIFIYNSVRDLHQSNIGIDGPSFTISGQTNFVKLQIEVAYPGSKAAFKNVLIRNYSNMLLQDMLFGGSLTDMFQNAYLLSLPDWFISGASRYLTYGWDSKMDGIVRDFFETQNFKKLGKLEGKEAEILGQSVWNFIAIRYGESNISNILNLTRIIRTEENSIASSLGVPYKSFINQWRGFYYNSNERVNNGYNPAPKEKLLVNKVKSGHVIKNNRVSPDGKKLAYVEHHEGNYAIKIIDLDTKNENTLERGGFRRINQKVDYNLPLLDWIDDNTLGYIEYKDGYYYLIQQNINNKSKLQKPLSRYQQINGLTFHSSGKIALLSASTNGQSDLFLISLLRSATRRITRDDWDDVEPQFIPGQDAFVFSSNRPNDTLGVNTGSELKDIGNKFNLFLYDLDTTDNVLYRLTNTLSNDRMPHPVNRNLMIYLSDQKGIQNLYKYNLTNNVFNELTRFNTDISEFDINVLDPSLITYNMVEGGTGKIFLDRTFNLSSTVFAPNTPRKDLLKARFISERLDKKRMEKDTIEESEKDKPTQEPPADDHIIDTDNYQFEDESDDNLSETESYLAKYSKFQSKKEVIGPLNYQNKFSADNIITSFVIDPLRGFGAFLETQMNDRLENHKIYGGVLAIADLKDGDIFGEYQYLKYKLDFSARFERNVILRDNQELSIQRYTKNSVTLGASLPITPSLRVSISPFYTLTNFYNLRFDAVVSTGNPNLAPDSRRDYIGFNSEIVFDNTLVSGIDLFQGTRGRLAFSQFNSINDNQNSFRKLTMDLRHYQQIHREFVFATKLYYGKSFGNNQQEFLLGGVDNWLFNRTDNVEGSPLEINDNIDNTNVLFTEFVDLRGFNYNRFSGTNVLAFNAELRFPIVKYFTRAPISSNFFRNLMLVGFYDFGSAWTGVSPFNRNNSINTREVQSGPFEATLRTSRNPWLSSYGGGFRTVILGYFLRLDVAWPIEDFETGNPKFHVSLGYDF